MSNQYKKCPICQENINADELICPYCGEKIISDKKKSNNKILIISIIAAIVIFILVIVLVCMILFIINPNLKNKEVIDSFRISFNKTYPNFMYSINDLKFNDLNILSKNEQNTLYIITVSNNNNSIRYSFNYNNKLNEISQIIPFIPDCYTLMEQESTKDVYVKYINNLASENKTFQDKNSQYYSYSSEEFISYSLLTKANEINFENITEKDNNKTSLYCEADTSFLFKQTIFKNIKAKVNIKFEQCKDDLAFCGEIYSFNNSNSSFNSVHKTNKEIDDVIITITNAKPYLKDYLISCFKDVSFSYYRPFEDKVGEYIIDIAKDGKIVSVTIFKSAERSLDNKVIETLKSIEYLNPLPDKYPEEVLTTKIKIMFEGIY